MRAHVARGTLYRSLHLARVPEGSGKLNRCRVTTATSVATQGNFAWSTMQIKGGYCPNALGVLCSRQAIATSKSEVADCEFRKYERSRTEECANEAGWRCGARGGHWAQRAQVDGDRMAPHAGGVRGTAVPRRSLSLHEMNSAGLNFWRFRSQQLYGWVGDRFEAEQGWFNVVSCDDDRQVNMTSHGDPPLAGCAQHHCP